MTKLLSILFILIISAAADATEYYKYTDRNGIDFWFDNKGKSPQKFPVQYKYEDKNGLPFWVDDLQKIPEEFRKQAIRSSSIDGTISGGGEPPAVVKRTYSTKISIANDQIIVPVIFTHKGRKIKARMILDTGASVTTIYPVLFSQLKLKKNKLTKAKSITANGATTDCLLTTVDYIEVDGKILANSEVMIMPAHSNIGADGLLGNSFLRFFNFTIDYDSQLLRWN